MLTRTRLLWILLSASAHAVLLGVLATVLAPVAEPSGPSRSWDVDLEAVAVANEPAPKSARVGDRSRTQPSNHRPADTLVAPRVQPGADQTARPRRVKVETAGRDLDQLRFQPYDHQERNSQRRRKARSDRDGPAQRRTLPKRSAPSTPREANAVPPEAIAASRRRIESPLDDHASPEAGEQQARQAATPSKGASQREREAASSDKSPDPVEMARASGHGSAAGAGQGTRAGRKGDPRGRRAGIPVWLNTADRRYVAYFKRLYRKIQPLWRFPKDLELAYEQGEVLVEFTVVRSGQLTRARVRKTSGHRRFDANALTAVRRAAPFPSIPAGLGDKLTILAPFEFHNPLVN